MAVALSALAFIAVPVRAEEPVLLAMANFGSTHLLAFHRTIDPQSLTLAPAPTAAPELTALIQPSFMGTEETMSFSTVFLLEKPLWSPPLNPLFTPRKDARETTLTRLWANFEAGYGQLFYDQTREIYGRHGTSWEEPGVGYFRMSFNF